MIDLFEFHLFLVVPSIFILPNRLNLSGLFNATIQVTHIVVLDNNGYCFFSHNSRPIEIYDIFTFLGFSLIPSQVIL